MRGVDLGVPGHTAPPRDSLSAFWSLLSSIARVADDLSSVVQAWVAPRPTSLVAAARRWDAVALACVVGVIVIEICARRVLP